MRALALLALAGVFTISATASQSAAPVKTIKPAAPSLETALDALPQATRKKVDPLLNQYFGLVNQLKAEWDETYRKDPLLRQAHEGRGELDHKIAAAREKMKQDVDAFVATGRGTAEQFKYWQSHYHRAYCKKELASDEMFVPYQPSQWNWIFENRRSSLYKQMIEAAGFQVEELTLEQVPDVVRKALEAEAAKSKEYFEAAEPIVQPTDDAKQHVLEFARYQGLSGVYAEYELLKTPPKFKKLHKQITGVVNELTTVWPDWRTAMFPAM